MACTAQRSSVCHCAKFHQNWSNGCRDDAFYVSDLFVIVCVFVCVFVCADGSQGCISLWGPFQNAAGSVTILYRGNIHSLVLILHVLILQA